MDSETLAAIWSQCDRLQQKPTIKPIDSRLCKECSIYKTLTREGMVCTECGRVDSIYVDDSAEWTSGVTDDGRVSDPSRCAVPASNHELFSDSWGKSTVIATKYNSTYQQKRMAKITFHNSMNHRDRSLYHAYRNIDRSVCRFTREYLTRCQDIIQKIQRG